MRERDVYNRQAENREWRRIEVEEAMRAAADEQEAALLDFGGYNADDYYDLDASYYYPDPDWYHQTKEGQVEECWSIYNEFLSVDAPRWHDESDNQDYYDTAKFEARDAVATLPSPRRLDAVKIEDY